MSFMYFVTLGLIGMEFTVAAELGYTLKNQEGEPIHADLLLLINEDVYKKAMNGTQNTVNNPADSGEFGTTHGVLKQMLTIVTGTYVFSLLALFGVDDIWITAIQVGYMFLIVIMIKGWLVGR